MARHLKPITPRPADKKYVDAKLRRIVATHQGTGHMHSSLLGCLEGMVFAISAAPTSADRAVWLRRANYFVATTVEATWSDAYRPKQDVVIEDETCPEES